MKGAKKLERKCFYLYDENGNEVHESRKEFTDHKKQKIYKQQHVE
jgi:hypothetical protein